MEDGYVGGSAPQGIEIYIQEIQDCETLDDAVALVEKAIEDDFRNHVIPSWDSDRLRKQIEEVWKERPDAD